MRDEMKQVNIRLPTRVLREAKAAAALAGESLQAWVARQILRETQRLREATSRDGA